VLKSEGVTSFTVVDSNGTMLAWLPGNPLQESDVQLRTRTFIVALVIAAGLACKDSAAPLAPYEPQINNIADDFQFQASGVTNLTWTYEYRWVSTGDSATVNQATTATGGSAVLTIRDGTGAQLYSQSLTANGTFGMTKGIQGNWYVRVQFTNYSGTVNFRVQKQ